MNHIKQEAWDVGCEFQDYQWNGGGQLPQSQSPYFMPEMLTNPIKIENEDDGFSHGSSGQQPAIMKEPKKRGRPKKVKDESGAPDADGKSGEKKPKQDSGTDNPTVAKKRRDRFNGMPEEEVIQRLLPDHIAPNLDILIIGINPGLFAAYVGHHYAGPGNHFWRCMYLAGLIPEPMSAYDDYKLINMGIGFTNICARTTRGSADLKKQELREGAEILRKKLAMYRPKIAVFNGKGIYEVFSGSKNFNIGKQPEKVEGTDTVLFVMPSSSARCAQLPRAADKVPFYLALKKLRDYLRGDLATLDDSEVVFPPIEPRHHKTEVKDEITDEDEDSRLSSGDSAKEMTLEQIQMQSEYLEALAASAEGKDIPMETWGGRKLKSNKLYTGENSIDTEASGSGDEVSQPYTPQLQQLKSKSELHPMKTNHLPSSFGQKSSALDIKQEVPYDSCQFEVVPVNGPSAQKVNLEGSSDPYQCHLSSTPEYMSLGDLPSKKGASSKSPRGSGQSKNFPQSSSQMQHLSARYNQSPHAEGRSPYPSQGTRVNAQNGSHFPHYRSWAGVTNGKEAIPSGFFNIE